jgi:hypothetical protein
MRMILFGITICVCFVSCGGGASNQPPLDTNAPSPGGSVAPTAQSNRGPERSQTPALNVQQLKVFITEPPDGATVTARPFITGTVADQNARVWVIVHPTEVGDYWVQQSTSPRDDKAWRG